MIMLICGGTAIYLDIQRFCSWMSKDDLKFCVAFYGEEFLIRAKAFLLGQT